MAMILMDRFMDWINTIIGSDNLNTWHMTSRAILVFLWTLVLIRIAGRRSFGLRAPLDNIVLILLGAILSRAVVGASPFVATLMAGLAISVLHRILALFSLDHSFLGKLAKGEKIILYQDGHFFKKNMIRCLVSEEEIREEVRLRTLVDSLDEVDTIYMERSGSISAVKKEKS